jgi:hypothetical protein
LVVFARAEIVRDDIANKIGRLFGVSGHCNDRQCSTGIVLPGTGAPHAQDGSATLILISDNYENADRATLHAC